MLPQVIEQPGQVFFVEKFELEPHGAGKKMTAIRHRPFQRAPGRDFVLKIDQSAFFTDVPQQLDPFEPLFLAKDTARLKCGEKCRFFLDFSFFVSYALEFSIEFIALGLCRRTQGGGRLLRF